MTRVVYLFSILLFSGCLHGQTGDLSGYWKNEQGVGANWGQYWDKVWFVSISDRWKEYFEGKAIAGDTVSGRLVKINLENWERTENRLEMVPSGVRVMKVLTPAPADSSFTAGKELTRMGFYTFYQNIPNPVFDEKHRDWEIKSWFQDGDTMVTVFYDYGHKSHVEKGVFVRHDSIQSLRWLSEEHNTCFTREVLHYKLERNGIIHVNMRDIDGDCRHTLDYARSATIHNRYAPNGHLPDWKKWVPIDAVTVAIPGKTEKAPAKNWIQAIRIGGEPVEGDLSVFKTQPLKIPFHAELELHIFQSGWEKRLVYQLEGARDDWRQAPDSDIIRFSFLPPGNYIFRLARASEAPGQNGYLAEIRLRFAPPFYLTPLFWLAIGLTGGLVILSAFWMRDRRRKRRDELRRQIARELHDDIGSTLSSISILAEAAKRSRKDAAEEGRINAIGNKAREAVEHIGDMVWSLGPKEISTERLLQRMKDFAMEILDPQDIAVHFEAASELRSLQFKAEQSKDLYLLFKEAVNNAAKYSQAKNVWVNLSKKERKIHLEIRDDGKGFDPDHSKRGNGLGNMQARAERLGGELAVESAVGRGTRVLLSFPG